MVSITKKQTIISIMNSSKFYCDVTIEDERIKFVNKNKTIKKEDLTGVVYFFLSDNDILKVGQTSRNLSNRLSQYRNHYQKDLTSIKCENYLKNNLNEFKFVKVYFQKFKAIPVCFFNFLEKKVFDESIDITKSVEKSLSVYLYSQGFDLPLQKNSN